MPNHVHPIAVPRWEDGLRRASGEAHRRYTRRINFREKWRAYLGQGRFASFVMHQLHLLAAARYVERNPLRAGLVADAAIREEETRALRDHGRTGHPPGSATFVQRLEQATGRLLRPNKPGRPAKLLKPPN